MKFASNLPSSPDIIKGENKYIFDPNNWVVPWKQNTFLGN